MNKEQEFVIREAWKALLFDVELAIQNIHGQVSRLETNLEIEDHKAWKALLFDVELAIKNIREEVDRLETNLEIEDRQVQRALEERHKEAILTSAGRA